MATTTLGIKVDETLRERLKAAAAKLGCTPHWLHKQAVLAYVDAIERGQLPAEISYLNGQDLAPDEDLVASDHPLPPFYAFAQDIQPQSVLRAAITSAYRRPEPECVALLLGQVRSACPEARTQELAGRLVQALRGKRKGGGVEGLIQEFSLPARKAWP